MPLGEMIYVPGRQIHYAYFPSTSIVSLHYVTESGASAESAGVGNEGVVGVPIFMGATQHPAQRLYKPQATLTAWKRSC